MLKKIENLFLVGLEDPVKYLGNAQK